MNFWSALGITLAVIVMIGGLFVVGWFVLVLVGLHYWAQNK